MDTATCQMGDIFLKLRDSLVYPDFSEVGPVDGSLFLLWTLRSINLTHMKTEGKHETSEPALLH